MRKILGRMCLTMGILLLLGTASGSDGQLESLATAALHFPGASDLSLVHIYRPYVGYLLFSLSLLFTAARLMSPAKNGFS